MDAIELSSVPVAITHSFSREVYYHDRGKSDEQMQALAAKNGYFGVLFCPFFLSDLSRKQTSLDDILEHVDHVAQVMGIEKVGIGMDWKSPAPELKATATKMRDMDFWSGFRKEHQLIVDAVIQGLKSWREFLNFTRGLVSRGYSDDEIKGILGGNFLRIFREVVG